MDVWKEGTEELDVGLDCRLGEFKGRRAWPLKDDRFWADPRRLPSDWLQILVVTAFRLNIASHQQESAYP